MNAKTLNDYQLGDSLGKGAFGQVYRALNWATGETVAIKEITLSNIPKAELGEIMSEISLLKNLNHPNIVKYKGFVKEREFLYIILEFCENGSLNHILKRFGKFPENLVAVYISQVLEGLVYLHDQGVIHRDIKGANLLTNKDGTVKLADFGVASTATTGVKDDAVVGSPYWMAPEVIEQSGATTASDIWSVGCVVIELLEGHPPYHTLDPMPALFRIVQDDCPPIPEGSSPVVKDFLLHCFQKDPNLRVSARKLLKHPWMVATRRQMESISGNVGGTEVSQRRPVSNFNYDEAVLKVQEWNEALRSPSRPSRLSAAARGQSPTSRIQVAPMAPLFPPSVSSSVGGLAAAAKAPVLQPEEQTDNWDDDFEEGISFTKLQALEKTASSQDDDSTARLPPAEEDNARTIKPNRSPTSKSEPLSATMAAIVEDDYSDLAEDNLLEAKVADFKVRNSFRRGLFHPDDIKTVGLKASPQGPMTAPLPPTAPFSAAPTPSPTTPTASSLRSTSGSPSPSRADVRSLFGKYTEDEEEDYDDVFGKPNGTTNGVAPEALRLTTRLSNKSWLGDEQSDEEDPFAEIDEGFAEDDLETNLQRDKYARLCNTVNQLIDELTPSAPDFQLRDACDQLINILQDTPEMQIQFVSSHGMLAILEVLEGKGSRDVILKLLQIINMLVTADGGFLESFCLIGGIPVMMAGFTSKKYPSECRTQASDFVRLLCHTSVLTLQMFISCRGLKVLVDLLDEDYNDQSQLVVHALNGIGSVFELQSPTTKNDFCRMFIREGLLDPLSASLLNVMATRGEASVEMKKKIIQILQVFAQVSQSDIHVRNALGTRKVVRRLLRACELLEPESLVQMLKAVKHLSMNPTLLEVLQNANAIEILVRILDEQHSGRHATEISNHVFQTCYNLCRLNKSRQEEAAQAGIIPCLKRVIETSSPLKQFALPILCDLASAGKSCRNLLWQQDGLGMYLKLLGDPYFQVSALESILAWLQDETARVEDELLASAATEALLSCFVNAKANSFENLLDPFLKITRISTPITMAIAKLPAFFRHIVDRLVGHNAKAVVRLNLLRLLRTAVEVHPHRATLVERYGLGDVVGMLSREDPAVLVRKLAKEIVPILRPSIRPSHGKGSPGDVSGVKPRRRPRGPQNSSGVANGNANGEGVSRSGSSRAPGRSHVVPKRPRRSASDAGFARSPMNGVAPDNVPSPLGPGPPARSQHPQGGSGSTAHRGRWHARHKLGEIPWNGQSENRP
ncbi:Pkinase-domain-containing protein [Fistulina hepatica ATCC 64428]|uniref:non-specific serine/threonine protein kinase n=1 Tax=Fistulina hepatica ATCC 64428 TaxID=1128425 RepID=A0A0D7AM95_9AGAR|nr:Pkinase-domain-containing protein [Fistulina hepatica ATCC 64428]